MLLSLAPMPTYRSPKPLLLAVLTLLIPSACTPAQQATAPPATPTVAAASPTPAPVVAPATADRSQSFDKELRLLFRMVACAGSESVPKEYEAVVARHCDLFQKTMTSYRTKYVSVAQPFLVGL